MNVARQCPAQSVPLSKKPVPGFVGSGRLSSGRRPEPWPSDPASPLTEASAPLPFVLSGPLLPVLLLPVLLLPVLLLPVLLLPVLLLPVLLLPVLLLPVLLLLVSRRPLSLAAWPESTVLSVELPSPVSMPGRQ